MTIDAIRARRSYEPTIDTNPTEQSKTSGGSKEAEARREAHLERDHRPLEYPLELFGRSSTPQAPASMAPSDSHAALRPRHGDMEYGRIPLPHEGRAEASGPVLVPGVGKVYTTGPNEVETTNTRPIPREVIEGIRARWPELSEEGAIALAAQSSAETGHWAQCWNWNFGNTKGSVERLHMYLGGTWEGFDRQRVREPDGKVRLETNDEVLARVRANDPAHAHLIQPDASRDHATAVGAGKVSIA